MPVYLLHFHESYKHARHYMGFAEGDIEGRVKRHRAGSGARLMRVIMDAGIGFTLARTWPEGTRSDERRLKNQRNSPRLCPICKADRARQRRAKKEAAEIVASFPGKLKAKIAERTVTDGRRTEGSTAGTP